MHDLHEADKILKIILDFAQKNKLKKISFAEIELGQIIEHGMDLNPENLEFNIKMLAKGTLAEGLELKIIKIKDKIWKINEIKGE